MGLAKDGGDLGQRPGLIDDVEPDEIAGDDFIDRRYRALALVRHKRRHAVFGAELQIQRGICQVAQHGARRGVFARAATIEQGVADNITPDEYRVEDVVDACQDVRVWHQRRVNRDLDAGGGRLTAGRRSLAPRRAALDLLDDPQQLDRVAELVGKLNVHPRNRADALHVDVLGVDPEAVRQRGQDANLMQRVVAVDVERRLGLGVPLRLGVLEDGVKIGPLHLHAGEDVIAGAVDDAVEVGDAVADKALAQGFDNGNAAANAGFVVQVRAVLPGRGEQLLAVGGEQGLIGGDDGFAKLQGDQNHRAGEGGAADQLGHDIHLRVSDDALPVRGHAGSRDRVRARLVEGLHGDFAEVYLHANAGGHQGAEELEGVKHAAAHGAAANHSQIYLLHKTDAGPVCWVFGPATINFRLGPWPSSSAKEPAAWPCFTAVRRGGNSRNG